MRKTVLFWHHTLLNKSTGSSEKLLRDLAKSLYNSNRFNVILVASATEDPVSLSHDNLTTVILTPHEHDDRALLVELSKKIEKLSPDLVIGLVWKWRQAWIRAVPKKFKLLLISPFGNYDSNGNVHNVYVSGARNLSKLRRLGVSSSELFYNPLRIPDYSLQKFNRHRQFKIRSIVCGRTGRSDPSIFDPISILAFAAVQEVYRQGIVFLYANPCDAARELADSKKIRNIKFLDWLCESELENFYNEMDIFLHARRDGETVGISIAEALIAQNVVVSHRSTVANEHLRLLKEPFGLFSAAGRTDVYATAIHKFCNSRQSLGDYGRLARETARPLFDRRIVIDRFLQNVSDIIDGKSVANPWTSRLLSRSLASVGILR